jgi:16S rRNA (guanine(966)-N(2))-methyltransferase RsmD
MQHLRVIAGRAKGRRLKAVPGEATRPIGDRVKEALFNILGADVEGAYFLDLFTGTGSVAIEALSRGAEQAVFIDNDSRAIRTVKDNLESTGLAGSALVLQRDAFAFLRGQPDRQFDLVYVAPPQFIDMWHKTLAALEANIGWLNPDAWVIAQMHPKEYRQLELKRLMEFDQRRYGNTLLVFYEYRSI